VTAKEKSVEGTLRAASVAEETADAEETVDAPTDELHDDGWQPGRLRRFGAWVRLFPAVVVVLAVAPLVLLGGLFYFSYRPDRATDPAAANAAISAASDGTVAVLSYSPDSLDRDFSSAKSHLTGDFLSYYDQFTRQIVAPAAKQKSVKTTAVVLRAALSEFHPDSAVVLLFVNQSTHSADRPEPTLTSSSVLVTLTKADGKWLISSFTPV
jgi:Mce-associated membrane protein